MVASASSPMRAAPRVAPVPDDEHDRMRGPMETRLDRHLTAADLDGLPHEWDTRYELIGGVLHMSTKPSQRHQRIIATFVMELGPVVRARGGDVVPEPGVVWEL